MCVVPKKHVRQPDCRQIGDIENIWYSGRTGVTYTMGQAATGLSAKALVNDVSVVAGDGFYELSPHNEGDAKPSFTNASELGDDGSFDRNVEFTLNFANDTPDTRDIIDNLIGKKIDLLIAYKSETGYKWEIFFDVELRRSQRNEKRREQVIVRRTNPSQKPLLVWKTDFATTETMIEGIIES